MEPQAKTNRAIGLIMCALGWFLIFISIFLTAAVIIPGLIGVVIGMLCIVKFSPMQCERPILKRKWPFVVSIIWVLFAVMNVVTPAPAQITSLTLNGNSAIQMDITETTEIPITWEDAEADPSEIQLVSSDESVLRFDGTPDGQSLSGVVTPTGEGEADISVSSGDVQSNIIHVTVIDSARIAAEEAAQKAEEEEAARKAAEEEAARQAAEEEAARQAAEEAAAQQEEASQETMVWIPASGSRYHSNPDCSGMNNPTQVPLSTAQARGYTACGRCY